MVLLLGVPRGRLPPGAHVLSAGGSVASLTAALDLGGVAPPSVGSLAQYSGRAGLGTRRIGRKPDGRSPVCRECSPGCML